jgi:Ca2+-binding RTX toxin-like protein
MRRLSFDRRGSSWLHHFSGDPRFRSRQVSCGLSGLGKDTLYGGTGRDILEFNAKPTVSNVDKIANFSVTNDTTYLENAVFIKLKAGKLASGAFWKGAKAHDSSDRIIYNPTKGYLYYDADGTGSSKQVLIATMSKKLKMTYSEFYVI